MKSRAPLAAVAPAGSAACHSVRHDAGRLASQRRCEASVHLWPWGSPGARASFAAPCPEA